MILKMLVRDGGHCAGGQKFDWLYLDDVQKVQTYSVGSREDSSSDQAHGQRLFQTAAELRDWVEEAWGPSGIRQFADEIWPEFPAEVGPVFWEIRPVRLERSDGSIVLALLNDEAFLLSDEGHTIDRLR